MRLRFGVYFLLLLVAPALARESADVIVMKNAVFRC
jgi:hypothetical protein